MANVLYLNGQPQPVVQFLRNGSSGHRHLEHLLAGGQLPVEAGAFGRQSGLIHALRQHDYEIVPDTNVAELSAIGGR
jgi:hypothetical protein